MPLLQRSSDPSAGAEHVDLASVFEHILETTSDLASVVAADGRLIYLNTAGLKLLGLSSEQTVGKSYAEFYPEWAFRIVQEIALPSARKQGFWSGELALRNVRGEDVPVSQVILSHADMDGRVRCYSIIARDVSERRRTETALRASESRFRALVQNSWDAFHLIDAKERILYESPAITRILGYQPEEVVGKIVSDFIHPDDLVQKTLAMQQALSGPGATATVTLRAKHRDGSWRWLECSSVNLLHLPDVSAVAVNFRDVTERTATRDRVHRSEATMAAAQRIAHFGSWELDLANLTEIDANPLRWSEEVFRLFGYEPGEIAVSNETFFRSVHPDDRDAIRHAISEALRTGTSYSIDHRIVRPTGEVRHVHEQAQIFSDPGTGRPLRLIGTVHDITERKLALEQLREQAMLLDIAADAIMVRDLADRIVYWNKSAERIYGRTFSEVVGQVITELLYKHPSVYQSIKSHVLAHGEWTGEVHQLAKDGREITVQSRCTLVRDERGAPKSLLTINSDITEKKRLEAQFFRAQRMESIGTLASGIAHDLNNVLAPIVMGLQLLHGRLVDHVDVDMLRTMEKSARRGAQMVRQVLTFARGAEGERALLEIAPLLLDAKGIVSETFPKSIRPQFDFAPGLWPVLGDVTQLHQVVLNLCVNARDAMPHGGELRVSAKNLVLEEGAVEPVAPGEAGPYVMIEIADTGTGISAEIRDKIFEPFFTTKPLGQGSGLGLATTLSIVKSHGGFIHVASEPGQGARFQIHLPAQVGARTEVAPEANARPGGRGELILVVDDEAAIRTIVTRTLAMAGYRVLTAANGAEAVEVFRQHADKINAVLTDMMMPVMDGPTAVQEIRRLRSDVPIVGASGIDADANRARAHAAGVDHFLPKPYTAELMLQTLAQLLHHH